MEFEPSKTAILVVHMQNDIVRPEGAFGAIFAQQATERHVIEHIRATLTAGRAAGATIVYLRIAWQSDYSDLVANSPLLGMVQQAGCLVDGTPGATIIEELTPQPGDLVVTHQRPGAFTSSQLDLLLRSRGVTTVACAGVATNASVEGTARQASDLGYQTLLIEDACSAADAATHAASAQSLSLLATISTVEEFTEALRAPASHAS
ncbi:MULTISPECIES: cysteine hydrolase family protein [unclassified Nocardioides]|uniref:cysteine hydrolase family protein n=1 Tax=unclassified Nocardioides TaxID=2615069 RepID=UPI0009F126CE|nr:MULTISPECIES: cysteine hydrolase family protein [unclassified Nocardioides]GAW48952.1 Cysteine hydrolase [Nocardioides sp. PD653-B2]GAW55167.1 Cysteine hydrolase [Nocardioides sp. PD653]